MVYFRDRALSTTQTPIRLIYIEFEDLLRYIAQNEGLSATFSWVLKRNKGWTYRNPYYGADAHIDFWNESAKSMFLLSYSHLIPKSLKTFNKNTG